MGILKTVQDLLGAAGSFRRNTLIMSSGAGLNVIISLLLYPIVTRIYSEEVIGQLGLFVAATSIISLAGTMYYPYGLVIPKFKKDFFALLKLCFGLAFISVVITCLVILFFPNFFLYVFKAHSLNQYLYLFPLGVALFSLKDIFINWNIRVKKFKNNALSNVAASSTLRISSITYGIGIFPSIIGLLVSQLLSYFIQIITLGISKIKLHYQILTKISRFEMKSIGLKHKKYPINILPANLINKYTSDLPIYLLTAYFSAATTGYFVLANSIMAIPVAVIGNSFAVVFLQKANELYLNDNSNLRDFTSKVYYKMLFLGILAFGVAFSFGDLLFSFVFGSNWEMAGKMAAILSIYFIFKLLSGPLAKIFIVVGKEQYALYTSSTLAILRTLGMFYGISTQSPLKAIGYFTLANIIGYLVVSFLVFKVCNIKPIWTIVQTIVSIAMGFTLFYLLRLLVQRSFDLDRISILSF